MLKYLVCPGIIRSKTDNDRHRITAMMLMSLYGVRPSECVVEGTPASWGVDTTELTVLAANADGDYSL